MDTEYLGTRTEWPVRLTIIDWFSNMYEAACFSIQTTAYVSTLDSIQGPTLNHHLPYSTALINPSPIFSSCTESGI